LELDTRYLTQQKNDSILMLETANSIVLLQVQKQRWQLFFLILLIVAVIGGGVFMVLYIKQRQEKLRDMALVRMREAERVRIARDMHDEVGSGLTRISLISEQLKIQKGSDAELKNENVSKIIKQSRLLSRNLKEIIWAVDPSNDKLSELLFYLRDYIYEFSSNTAIECKIDFQDDILDFEVASEVRRNLFLALKEILNNVAKHANAKVVIIKFDMKNNLGYLLVKDNGIGFSATNVKKGVGLGSIKSRTEKLEGDFFIESKTGEGTSIYLKNLVLNTTKM
jgi:signal transduction histidine kinase